MGRPMQNQSARIAQSQLILWNLVNLRSQYHQSSPQKHIGPKFVDNNIWLRLYEQQLTVLQRVCIIGPLLSRVYRYVINSGLHMLQCTHNSDQHMHDCLPKVWRVTQWLKHEISRFPIYSLDVVESMLETSARVGQQSETNNYFFRPSHFLKVREARG